MADIPPDIERRLAEMTDAEFAALTARVRAPDSMEQFRDIAKTIVPEHLLDDFLVVANPVAFVDEDGCLDEARVRANLHVVFGQQQSGSREWVQYRSRPTGAQAGDAGREEARRRAAGRSYVASGTEIPAQSPVPGFAGSAEAQKRLAATGIGGTTGV